MTAKDLIDAYISGKRDFCNANLIGANLSNADLRSANLSNAYLGGANLSNAYLGGANLIDANLYGADLRSANLYGADLSNAYLGGANLIGANLSNAYLGDANLYGADLRSANLIGANLRGAKDFPAREIARRQILPTIGDLHVWKKLDNGTVCQLLILSGTPRVGGVIGRKCRAQMADVVSGKGPSMHDPDFHYTPGITVTAENWDPDPLVECSGGIHFFITREEAEDYV